MVKKLLRSKRKLNLVEEDNAVRYKIIDFIINKLRLWS